MYNHQQQQSQYHSLKKSKPSFSYNQTLQQLLQVQTIHSHLSSTKKNLFNSQLSFFSKDHTHDHTNQQGYQQILKKVHFQHERTRQLKKKQQLVKKNHIDMYMTQLMDNFNQLSEQNKLLREQYRKQIGVNNKKVNNSMKDSIMIGKKNSSIVFDKNNNILNTVNFNNINFNSYNNSQTPRNIKTRRSIAGGCIPTRQSINLNTSLNIKPNNFNFSNAFIHHKKHQPTFIQQQKHLIKQSNCQSSINFNNNTNNNLTTQQQHLNKPLKKHKRRQSQLTQRKDYPNQLDYLQIFDDKSQVSYNDEEEQRYMISQNGKMMKKYEIKNRQNQYQSIRRSQCQWGKQDKCSQNNMNINRYINNNNNKQQHQQQYFYQPTTSKNIFLQFLQQLLLQQKVISCQPTSLISDNIQQTLTQQQSFEPLSYQNLRHIESLQQQITKKNRKLQQLQEVINIFKEEIENVVGTDIKQVNQLMISLLQVKGKYIQMQDKVNRLKQLQEKYNQKQQIKNNILKQTVQKNKNKQNNTSNNNTKQQQPFPIPQSLKTLFQILQLPLPSTPKPIDYLTQIKQLSKNKQLYHAFNTNKRSHAQNKIKQIIDSIRQGRKKFNQVIKIYQNRIVKFEEKIMKCKSKANNNGAMVGSQKKNCFKDIQQQQKGSQNKNKSYASNKQNYC